MEKKLFDFCIGNPPYQETLQNTSDKPVYNDFMDASYSIASIVELITPARFLFDAGKTPKIWNEKMLNDPHLKVLHYESNSALFFANTDIKGGVAITYYNDKIEYGSIGSFTPYKELNSILKKIKTDDTFCSICKIIITSFAYRYTEQLHMDYPEAEQCLSIGHKYDIKSNAFDRLPMVFSDEKPNDNNKYIQILGRQNNVRLRKYIKENYVNKVENLDKYKLFMSKANGTGAFGEILTLPDLCEPGVGATESFVGIGLFDTKAEAENLLKYIKTKFMRALLGVVKITQDLTPAKWKYVPLQDFSASSDIDWSKSIHEIDLQLYHKYNLNDEEITFIEENVKEMS